MVFWVFLFGFFSSSTSGPLLSPNFGNDPIKKEIDASIVNTISLNDVDKQIIDVSKKELEIEMKEEINNTINEIRKAGIEENIIGELQGAMEEAIQLAIQQAVAKEIDFLFQNNTGLPVIDDETSNTNETAATAAEKNTWIHSTTIKDLKHKQSLESGGHTFWENIPVKN